MSAVLTYAVELRRLGLSYVDIATALGYREVQEARRLLSGNPLQLPERVHVFEPRGAGDTRWIVMAHGGPFMRLIRIEGRALAEHVAREWERGVYPPNLIGELRRCLQPARKEQPECAPS